jgi:hypothetical protein
MQELSDYHFTLHHLPGEKNIQVDTLSRLAVYRGQPRWARKFSVRLRQPIPRMPMTPIYQCQDLHMNPKPCALLKDNTRVHRTSEKSHHVATKPHLAGLITLSIQISSLGLILLILDESRLLFLL